MSQRQVAASLGLSRRTIEHIERSGLTKLAEGLGLPIPRWTDYYHRSWPGADVIVSEA